MGAVYYDDPREAEVNGGAQKSRGDSKTNEVDQEVAVVKGVRVYPNSSDIADDLKQLVREVSQLKARTRVPIHTKPKNVATMYPHVLNLIPRPIWVMRYRPNMPAKRAFPARLGM